MPRVRRTIEVTLLLLLLALELRSIVRWSGHWPPWRGWLVLTLMDWAVAAWCARELEQIALARQPAVEQEPPAEEPELAPTKRYEQREDGWRAKMANGKERPMVTRERRSTETRPLIDHELGRPPQ